MPFPPNDGGTIATLNMIKGFMQQPNELVVLAMQTHKHSFPIHKLPSQLANGAQWFQVQVNTKINPIKAVLNLLFSKKPYNAVRFESKAFAAKLVEILETNSFDVIQLEGLYLYSYIHIIRKFSKAKIALRAHNVEHEIWLRLAKNETFWIKRLLLNQLAYRVMLMEFDMLNKIDLLIPITQRDAQILKFKDASKVMVSPTGIDHEKYINAKPLNPRTIFYIGALDWLPNNEGVSWFLKNVWVDLQPEFPQWQFVLAGRNASKSFVESIKNYPVTYIGEVESSTHFIDNHNIMIAPLLSGSGMRIKIIEGMARGKCIVTTQIGAEGIQAKNGTEIFISDTPSEFKSVLINLMTNPELIENCGENAFIFVNKNFDNTTIISELRNFYIKHTGN